MSPPTGLALGIDIGGTKILAIAVDPRTATVVSVIRRETPSGSAALAAEVVEVATELISTSGATSIGLGIPGLVNRDGILRYGPNVPGIVDLDLVPTLRARTGLVVRATNDGACAALAEHRLGAGVGSSEMLFVAQGTGIAGGHIINGRLATGAYGFAGEPGHMAVQLGGPMCACGRTGCWEAVASGAGLVNLAYEVVDDYPAATWLRRSDLRGEDVMAAFESGDPAAEEVLDRFVFWVARGLGSLISLLDPELVVLGGGLSRSNGNFLHRINDAVEGFVIGAGHRPSVPIVAAQFGEHAGAIGAALFGIEPV